MLQSGVGSSCLPIPSGRRTAAAARLASHSAAASCLQRLCSPDRALAPSPQRPLTRSWVLREPPGPSTKPLRRCYSSASSRVRSQGIWLALDAPHRPGARLRPACSPPPRAASAAASAARLRCRPQLPTPCCRRTQRRRAHCLCSHARPPALHRLFQALEQRESHPGPNDACAGEGLPGRWAAGRLAWARCSRRCAQECLLGAGDCAAWPGCP